MRFELTIIIIPVFKTGALDHSATRFLRIYNKVHDEKVDMLVLETNDLYRMGSSPIAPKRS